MDTRSTTATRNLPERSYLGSLLAQVRVLPKDPVNGLSGVVTVRFDPIYYTLPNQTVFTNFGLHMTLQNVHQTWNVNYLNFASFRTLRLFFNSIAPILLKQVIYTYLGQTTLLII